MCTVWFFLLLFGSIHWKGFFSSVHLTLILYIRHNSRFFTACYYFTAHYFILVSYVYVCSSRMLNIRPVLCEVFAFTGNFYCFEQKTHSGYLQAYFYLIHFFFGVSFFWWRKIDRFEHVYNRWTLCHGHK